MEDFTEFYARNGKITDEDLRKYIAFFYKIVRSPPCCCAVFIALLILFSIISYYFPETILCMVKTNRT